MVKLTRKSQDGAWQALKVVKTIREISGLGLAAAKERELELRDSGEAIINDAWSGGLSERHRLELDELDVKAEPIP